MLRHDQFGLSVSHALGCLQLHDHNSISYRSAPTSSVTNILYMWIVSVCPSLEAWRWWGTPVGTKLLARQTVARQPGCTATPVPTPLHGRLWPLSWIWECWRIWSRYVYICMHNIMCATHTLVAFKMCTFIMFMYFVQCIEDLLITMCIHMHIHYTKKVKGI